MTDISWEPDYRALTTKCGVVTLDDWSQVQLEGADRVKFLHNMCTNDIRKLEVGQMCEAFCTDVKGKIVAHVFVIAEPDRLTLLTVPGQAERIIKHLDRYIIREDVQLENVGNQYSWNYIVGSHANDCKVPDNLYSVECKLLWPGGRLVRTAKLPEPPFVGMPIFDTQSPVWTAVRTESSFPLYGTDFDDSYLPQEINRDAEAISFNKGCYLGQETVARIDALGHVNKKLVLVKFAGEDVPAIGSQLTNGGQDVGNATTASWSPRFGCPMAIAVVRRGSNDVRTQLESEYGPAEVIAPPSSVS